MFTARRSETAEQFPSIQKRTSKRTFFFEKDVFMKEYELTTQKGLEPSTSGVTGRHSNQLSYWATKSSLHGILKYVNTFTKIC